MRELEMEIENRVFEIFRQNLPKSFDIRRESRLQTRQGRVYFDIAINYNGILYSIIEIKSHLRGPLLQSAKDFITRYVNTTQAYCGIVTDYKDYYLYTKGEQDFEKKSFKEIIDFLIENIPQPIVNIPLQIEQLFQKDFFDNTTLKERIKKNIYTNKSGILFCPPLNFDDYFEKYLTDISNKNQKEYYRYVPFDTAFEIIKNGTYRMNGIAGMNDKSEGDLLDSISYEIEDSNNIFISSFSTLEDNLTMWRLYGDNAKGVCLVFTGKDDYEDKDNLFWLYPVSYDDKYKNIVIDLYNNGFKINNIEKWIYFFKNKHFKTEEEVRLLVQNSSNKKEWYKTNDNSIINSYIELKLDDNNFPLKLTKIILGPKCPESGDNKMQMEAMLKEKMPKQNIKVMQSEIEIYR